MQIHRFDGDPIGEEMHRCIHVGACVCAEGKRSDVASPPFDMSSWRPISTGGLPGHAGIPSRRGTETSSQPSASASFLGLKRRSRLAPHRLHHFLRLLGLRHGTIAAAKDLQRYEREDQHRH